jgi:hypothetical protein
VRWTAADDGTVPRYSVRVGDIACDSEDGSGSGAFDYAARDYADANAWRLQWGYRGASSWFAPQVQLWCGGVNGCTIEVTVCMNVYRYAFLASAGNRPFAA